MTTNTAKPPDLASKLAQLWGATVSPPQTAPRLPPLPEPLRCNLDHSDRANWQFGPDRYHRPGFRRVMCKRCEKFYGYLKTED